VIFVIVVSLCALLRRDLHGRGLAPRVASLPDRTHRPPPQRRDATPSVPWNGPAL